jgi:hypothetical protein
MLDADVFVRFNKTPLSSFGSTDIEMLHTFSPVLLISESPVALSFTGVQPVLWHVINFKRITAFSLLYPQR